VQTVPFCVHRWTPNGQECCKQLSNVVRIRKVIELRNRLLGGVSIVRFTADLFHVKSS